MAFTPGGRADKFGNQYESMWVANRLLDILFEHKYRSVIVEAIGEDEDGVDLWVEDFDGNKVGEQCKARNGSSEKWSVPDLREVLTRIPTHVSDKNDQYFKLVSPIPFNLLGDLCNDAQTSDNSEAYYTSIVGSSEKKKKIFSQLCKVFNLDEGDQEDRRKVYLYLKRFHIEYYPSSDRTLNDLNLKALSILSGTPSVVVSLLRSFVFDEKMLGKEINSQHLLNYLAKYDIHPKQKLDDHRLSTAFNTIRFNFNDSISSILISNTLLKRKETDKCIESLKLSDVVILHGEAGCGKSGVLYELMQRLEENGIQSLPIKLDRNIPRGSTKTFGIQIGLPDSPSKCLASYSGKKTAVLILDQLDAIRWTSRSSLESIDVCKQLIREVFSHNKYADGDLKVVIVCRTFDLENDPEIKNWLSNIGGEHNFSKIEVKELEDEDLKSVVGTRIKNLSSAQLRILKNPQNLFMWQVLKDENISFVNPAELMRGFWRFKRQKLEDSGLDRKKIDEALNAIVTYMEKKGEISVPERVLEKQSNSAINSLFSHSIIQQQNNRVSFCHQSYLDYLVADRVFTEIDNGGSVLQWLGDKKDQSLYRRQQLSIFLFLLVKESESDFIKVAREVLFSSNARFHVKHLVFEVFSQMSATGSESLDLLDELISSSEWKEYAIKVSVMRNVSLVKHLVSNGVLSSWLTSENEEEKNDALSIIRSVVEESPGLVEDILVTAYRNNYISKEGAFSSLAYYFADDSDSLFQFRLLLIHDGLSINFIDWRNLASRSPYRAIAIIKLLALLEPEEKSGDLSSYNRKMNDHDLDPIFDIAKENYNTIWDELLDVGSQSLTKHNENEDKYRYSSFDIEKRYGNRRSYLESFSDLSILLIIEAGKKIAEVSPSKLFNELKEKHLPDNAVGLMYKSLSESYSDHVISWLLEDDNRLSLGRDYERPKWMIAADLLKKFSKNCNIENFQLMESKLYAFTPQTEDFKRSYGYHVTTWRHDIYFPAWGEAQFLLLPALDQSRISTKTKDFIQVLIRKFGKYSDERFYSSSRVKGGMIGSKLEPFADKISDQSWISIITNKKVNKRHDHSIWQQVDDETVHVSSHDEFAGTFERSAKKNPKRFLCLFERLPVEVNTRYIAAMLSVLSLKEPENKDSEDWEKVSQSDIEGFWAKYRVVRMEREVARSFCGMIKKRSDEKWSNLILEDLFDLAINHHDPENASLTVWSKGETYENASTGSLYSTAINCVRGAAIEAIGSMLWSNHDLIDEVECNIEKMLNDKHPSIMMSIQSIVLPVQSINENKALSWFVRSCEKDVRVTCTRESVHIFNYAMKSKNSDLVKIINRMLLSQIDEVVELGAEMAMFYSHCYGGILKDEVAIVETGDIHMRKGAVKALKNLIKSNKFAYEEREKLAVYFHDNDKEVRDQASQIFFNDDFLNTPENLELAFSYVNSKAFLEGDRQLFNSLDKYRGSLINFSELVLTSCQQMLKAKVEREDVYAIRYEHKQFVTLLIRLYDQAGNKSELRDKCLDIWDLFFKENIDMTREITNIISK